MIGIALWVMAITVVWYFGDKADAASEVIIHAAGFAILILAFPAVYLSKLFQIAPRLAGTTAGPTIFDSDAATLEKWRTLDPLLLEQAACLWCEKPPLPSIFKSDSAVHLQVEKLKRAVLRNELAPAWPPTQRMIFKTDTQLSSVSGAIASSHMLNEETPISVRELKRYAETIGERPAFLWLLYT